MADSHPPLNNPPIVEAVLDVDCDVPVCFQLDSLAMPGMEAFRAEYPVSDNQFLEEFRFERKAEIDKPITTAQRTLRSLRFKQEDGRQLVQIRAEGFSFNRLAPYTSLDFYLPEIQRTWDLYRNLVQPVQIRRIQLRYINRLPLPTVDGKVQIDDYLKVGPRLADEEKLTFLGFFHQHSAVETETGNVVTTVLATDQIQPATMTLPLLFDITAHKRVEIDPVDWPAILEAIQSLRGLKNCVFHQSLTELCRNLFQD